VIHSLSLKLVYHLGTSLIILIFNLADTLEFAIMGSLEFGYIHGILYHLALFIVDEVLILIYILLIMEGSPISSIRDLEINLKLYHFNMSVTDII
jgi:hypothetical protein